MVSLSLQNMKAGSVAKTVCEAMKPERQYKLFRNVT